MEIVPKRLSAGRARDHPVMEIVPNKALSLSLSLSLIVGAGELTRTFFETLNLKEGDS